MLEAELGILLKVVIGALLGGIVGFERERAGKPAGARTSMLVGAASVILITMGPGVVNYFTPLVDGRIQTDPLRVLEAIVVGVSFIGAGTIIQQKGEGLVHNLTTAATLLAVAGIGGAVALNYYLVAAGTTLFVLVVNMLLPEFIHKKSGKAARQAARKKKN